MYIELETWRELGPVRRIRPLVSLSTEISRRIPRPFKNSEKPSPTALASLIDMIKAGTYIPKVIVYTGRKR